MSSPELELRAHVLAWREEAKAWFARQGRPVTIVIPSYRDGHLLKELFVGLVAHTTAGKYRVIVTDDASNDAAHSAYLDGLAAQYPFVTVMRNDRNGGFAVNVNRALRLIAKDQDVVLMNSDVVPLDGWLAGLQYSLHLEPADLLAPKMLYPNGTIQFCGGMRLAGKPRAFDHRLRFAQEYFPPATVRVPTLYATGAVLYIPAATRARIGLLDERYTWGHDDVDYSVQCWRAGGRVVVEPRATVTHIENATIGRQSPDPRIAQSHRWFWEKNGEFFHRNFLAADGRVRVLLVTSDLGGQADFARARLLLERLSSAGFSCELWNLGGAVHFLDGQIPSRGFGQPDALSAALDGEDGLKLFADWRIAQAVWLGSIRRGVPVYWPVRRATGRDAVQEAQIQASYLPEFTIVAPDATAAESITAAGHAGKVRVADAAKLASILREIADGEPSFAYSAAA